jgi:hypothetical protein
VRVARERVEEAFQVLVQQRVLGDLAGEVRQLRLGGQLAVDQQVADLEEVRMLRQLLDRVTAVAQDARVAVDIGDFRRAGRRVHEARVKRHQAGGGQQLRHFDTRRARGRGLDRKLELAAWVSQRY